ncbi:hypothetical protein SteCoe_34861 [Stentor coeruleus]|uniref:Clusterin-associated protein 1 n=1 Tax=Stentor coeruleus TaxID=5963 RepID=A0A1R2ATN3_9CILI|nr:hypothetical protein SteCoe_34861 [Stentor coeruleus]
MAFRELRNFCETMRALGYNRIISMENFRTPNFELIVDIIEWLMIRIDPDCDVNGDIEEERQRVAFIINVTKFFLSKTRIKLNMKKLYQADGYAIRELLKITSMLYKAQTSSSTEINESSDFYLGLDLSLNTKLQNLKSARELASEITESGAKIFDLLSREKDLKEARDKALGFLDNISRNLDSNAEQEYIRNCIRDIINSQTGSLSQMEKMLEELEKDEKSLETKIKKRSVELERAEKRIKSLQSVRPAYMDEYERLEQEVEKLYETFVVKFRNLSYLEHDLEAYRVKDEGKKAVADKDLDDARIKIKKAEEEQLRGAEDFDDGERIENNEMRFEAARPTEARNHNRRNYAQEESEDENFIDDDEEEGNSESQDEEEDEEMEIDSDSNDNNF